MNLSGAEFIDTDLNEANLSKANLRYASFIQLDLSDVDLSGADLTQAYFSVVNLTGVDLSGADLSSAHLYGCSLIETDLHEAVLVGCNVYGSSVWNVNLTDTNQEQLIISKQGDPVITVDNLEVAQFIYLLLNNQRIRHIIDSITTKVVLILGNFTLERKQVLNAIREELRRRDYLPVLFDFDKPASRDITETVSTLAHMARFIIADITAAKSIPQELMRIVPSLPSVPVQPLLQIGAEEYGMFEHFKRFPWVLETYYYEDAESICSAL